MEIQLTNTSWCRHVENVCLTTDAEFEELWMLKPSSRDVFKILGREVELPRFQQTYGMTYSFSGITCNAKEIPPLLQPYLDYANNADTSEFNGILVNWYEDGGQYVGYHSDNEKQLIKNSPIYCFSLGGTRTFKIKDKATKQVQSFKLNNGDLFIMGGTMQQTHLHTITKTVKLVGRRISITLRKFAE